MSIEAKKIDAYAEWAALPDRVVGEILAGELHVTPRPRVRHTQASSVLGSEIIGPFQRGTGGPGGWWILDEPELHLGPDIVVPDLAGWRKEKLPVLRDEAYLELAPDWVCEVLSKSTACFDRIKKLPIYAREKVKHVWLIDPELKMLEVYVLQGPGWFLAGSFAGDEKVRAEPFDAIELDLGALWLPDGTETP